MRRCRPPLQETNNEIGASGRRIQLKYHVIGSMFAVRHFAKSEQPTIFHRRRIGTGGPREVSLSERPTVGSDTAPERPTIPQVGLEENHQQPEMCRVPWGRADPPPAAQRPAP